jgi:hypothetical protein
LIGSLYGLICPDYFKQNLLFSRCFEQKYWSRCSHKWVFKGMGRAA